jgi:hypothetical protein
MAMDDKDWKDVHVGDVLINDRYGQCYVVTDTGGQQVVMSRTVVAVDGLDWTRMRKTVDA